MGRPPPSSPATRGGLVVLAALRPRRLLCRAARRARAWLLAAGAGGHRDLHGAAVPRGYAGAGRRVRDCDRHGAADRFMPAPRQGASSLIRIVTGLHGAVEMECDLRLLFDFGRVLLQLFGAVPTR